MPTNFPVFKKTSGLFMSGIRWSVCVVSTNGIEVGLCYNLKEEWECDGIIRSFKQMFLAGRFNLDLGKVQLFDNNWINSETREVLCKDW